MTPSEANDLRKLLNEISDSDDTPDIQLNKLNDFINLNTKDEEYEFKPINPFVGVTASTAAYSNQFFSAPSNTLWLHKPKYIIQRNITTLSNNLRLKGQLLNKAIIETNNTISDKDLVSNNLKIIQRALKDTLINEIVDKYLDF